MSVVLKEEDKELNKTLLICWWYSSGSRSVESDSCNSIDCSLSGSSVRGVLQARTLEWVAIPFSRGSSWPRNWTLVFCIAGRFFTVWATREAHYPQTRELFWVRLHWAAIQQPLNCYQDTVLMSEAWSSYLTFLPWFSIMSTGNDYICLWSHRDASIH